MSDDLKRVEQLEKETGIKLKRVPLEKIGYFGVIGFAADDNGWVRGLAIFEKKLRRLPELLSKFQRLEKLALISTEIRDISSLKELKGLTMLYLDSNQISDISSLNELKGLTYLFLSNNQISDISSLNELKGLTYLDLAANQISDISSLKELKNLKVLYLMANKITHMPAEFLDLGMEIKWEFKSPYEGIFLYDNPLESPPVEIVRKGNEAIRQYFKSLEATMRINSDDLKRVEQLEKETGITLKRIPLENIGPWKVTGFAADDDGSVRGLAIGDKKLRRLPALLSKFQRLEKLALMNTQTSDISSLKELKGLTVLILVNNQISDISSLKELKGLTVLNLDENQISDISSLKELKGLTDLSLSSNQISNISSLKELKNLKQLYLMANKITHMPAEFFNLGLAIKWEWDGEDGIFLKDNPLESPPVEIIKKGNEAIRQYFKSLEGEKQALNEVKVLLVGDGAAGKTSLVKRLLGKRFDKNESQTHGININTMEITQNNCKIKIHLWDFGGQEIMHATHQFFLSKRSLYILVLDGRKDEKTEYWLNHIKSFGGDSPVIVVLNKIDQNPGFDLNRRFLMEKYPNIKGFYPLSCATGDGIDPLKKALTNELARVELIRTTWPKSWFNVKNRLENMKEDFIDYKTYRDICAEEKIDREAMETLVAFLNDLGVILHFKEYLLEETQVLRPQWLTGAVYKIVTSKQLSAAKGLLDRSQLKEILAAENEGDDKYPESQYKFIIGMMKKFELCYTLENDRDILVPDLLEVGEPEIPFDSSDALKFLVSYNFLPPSVMPRLIVRLHRDIKDQLRWRSGVVLENRGFDALAVVKSDDREKTISMAVIGAQRREYLAVILNTIREINAGFDKIDVSEKVPLPDNPGIGVDYLYLLRLERRGQQEFLPEKADKDYNVKELLDGIKPIQARQKDLEQFFKEGKLEIIVQPTPPPPPVKDPKPKGFWQKTLRLGKAIAAVIGILAVLLGAAAALFALLDSASFKAVINDLFGK